MNTKPTIGFIGLGLMGTPMSQRLLKAGYALHIWNRTPHKCQPLIENGAIQAASMAELVKAVDIVMLCVSNTEAVEAIIYGNNTQQEGVIDHLHPQQIIIDFSSISPEATTSLAKAVEARGAAWIDSPVSGGVAGAEQGTLAIMCGGDKESIDSIRLILEPLSQRVTRMGPVGSGQTTKLCNQMMVSCNVLVMAEALAMAEKGGVDATQIPKALKGGFADSIPLQLTGSRMADKDFEEIKWHIKTLLKDLDMVTDFSKTMSSATPMAGLAAQLMRLHASQGYADQDPATLIKQYQDTSL
ncbi:MAG: 2-hydroxy-3-oxopropionate reductase (EC [uncultured Thiotrichaceae bacterium]|uniref:2-hydroxy-3-oxopropionate reductase (EC) n=1 Tax=uncultured Thiotrichaceae bacterium TaxID=298394 RepID=A0A6S6SX26_9GAMM|nr:MAG: 2-hydroxy-3-oxopropionate reductase (EC [uncultured Thiotrichaceae bacterium]